MARRRIVILSGNHLCNNPRVAKEAECLADAGFDVEVLGAALRPDLAARDAALPAARRFRFSPVVRLFGANGRPTLHGHALRAQRWCGTRVTRWLRRDQPWALGYGVDALEGAARRCAADLYIAHSEAGLWVASRLARDGARIGVDMEDWYSRDLLPEARRWRPLGLLARLEAAVLRVAAHRTCPSSSMSEALARTFGVAPPTVIYNAFPWSDRARLDHQRLDRVAAVPSLHWFSQTIGPGRGLEDLLAALPALAWDAEVHLRGTLSTAHRAWLEQRIPATWRSRVFVHAVVPHAQLLSRIAEHDIGLALDCSTPPSRDLTVSNKVLHYLLAGVAVIASATAGQVEISRACPEGVRLYPPGNAPALAAAINGLLGTTGALARAREASLRAAQERYCWERIAPRLLASVEAALSSPPPAR